nr:uncharacterized protein LOC109771369 [Aegilops tauschii subsp. strangulata]
MATWRGSDDGGGGGAGDASGGSGAPADPTEVCGSSNPSQAPPLPQPPSPSYCAEYAAARAFAKAVKEDPEGSHHYASSFGGVSLNDEVWEVRFHFHDRDNLERSLNVDDITFYNLIALIELEGYGMTDFMYYVRDPGVGVSGMEELTDDDKVEEMLDDLVVKGQKVVNITVIRSDAPRPSDLNIGPVCEEQVPLSKIGVPVVYEIDTAGVLFPSPTKPQQVPVQVINTQESTFLKQKCAPVAEFAMEQDQDQEQIEQLMEQKRNEEIEKFRKKGKEKEKYKAAKRKLPELMAEDFTDSDSDTDLLADEDIIARLEAMKKHRDDPLHHIEGDTDEDWFPSFDEESNPGDLSEEDNDGAQIPCVKLPADRKSRAKKRKPRVWYDEQRENPEEQFMKKLCFLDLTQFRRALLNFHISQNRNHAFHRNCPDRIIAVCKFENCPFFIAASQIAHEKTFCIKKLNLHHSCPVVGESTKVTAKWLAHECEQQLRTDPNTPVQTIISNLKQKHGIEVSIHMAYRARKLAKNVVLGDQKAQYHRIRDYLEAVLETNPGSRCIVTTKHLKLHPSKNPRFHGLFICLNACKEGFLNGCRPFIGVDGCFIKLTTGQQILAATGRDGNNNIFPIAFAIVDKENTASWSWFLTQLKYAIGGESGKFGYYTIISDRQKGLLTAINNVFPNCKQRFCLRHIYQNFQTAGFRGEELKKYMYQASYSYTEHGYVTAMEGMKKECEPAWKWLSRIPKHTWARHAMDNNCKTDLVVNNISEVFNKMILDVRAKPIRTMVDGIRTKLLVKFNANRTKTETAKWQICPTYAEKLEEAKHHSRFCQSIKAGPDLFQVTSGESTYAVNLLLHTCGCRKWYMCGVPCNHGVSAINKAKLQPEDFVHDFFKKPMYKAAYSPIVFPVPGPDLWPKTRTPDIEPPVFKEKPGNKETKRRKSKFEKPAPKDTSRMATITCSNCNRTGHRYTSCKQALKPSLAMRMNQHQENRRDDTPRTVSAPGPMPPRRSAPSAPAAAQTAAPAPPAPRAPRVSRRAPSAPASAPSAPRRAPSAPAAAAAPPATRATKKAKTTRTATSTAGAGPSSTAGAGPSSSTAAGPRGRNKFIPPRVAGSGRVRKPSFKMSEWFNYSQGSR